MAEFIVVLKFCTDSVIFVL